MAKKATKLKDQVGVKSKPTQVLPSVEVTQEQLELEKWLADDVESLASKSFASEQEAIDCLIAQIGTRVSDDSEDLKLFITELIESDPALKNDILSVLKIEKK